MPAVAPDFPIWHAVSRKHAAYGLKSRADVNPWIAGINRISRGFRGRQSADSGPFPLDFGQFFRYPSTNTPASPLPLCGDAYHGQVFLCADRCFPLLAEVVP